MRQDMHAINDGAALWSYGTRVEAVETIRLGFLGTVPEGSRGFVAFPSRGAVVTVKFPSVHDANGNPVLAAVKRAALQKLEG